ncbi:hypothetical protein [Streptomyces sp. NPDC026589]|uniref:hypothetical protein n=1 Tax=Streptomyces sp. NPDC026589 TaxID=3155609 RepID=UPI0033F16BCA
MGALPFGGRGKSGSGRIHGADGLREFAVPQVVARRLFKAPLAIQTYARGLRDVPGLESLIRKRTGL